MEGTACITKIVKERHEEPVTVYNLTVKDWVSYFVGNLRVYVHNGNGYDEDNVIANLSNKALKHAMNDHIPAKYAKQLQHMNKQFAEKYLSYKTFFNPNWTDKQVKEALNFGYKAALKNNVTTGKYSFMYLGEQIEIYLENGVFKTGYGDYVYTYDKLIKLLGGK